MYRYLYVDMGPGSTLQEASMSEPLLVVVFHF